MLPLASVVRCGCCSLDGRVVRSFCRAAAISWDVAWWSGPPQVVQLRAALIGAPRRVSGCQQSLEQRSAS